MTSIHQKILFASTLAAALSFGNTASSQFRFVLNNSSFNQSVSKSYSRSLGSSCLGVTGYAYGYMRGYRANPSQVIYTGRSMTMSSAHARGYLRATGSILKQTRELARFDARGDVYSTTTGNRISGSYRLVLAGRTMVSKSFSRTTSFPRFARYVSLFPTDPRADIPVGPFTLTLKGNAGAGIDAGGFASLSTSPAVNLSCYAKAYGQARAKVEFGIFGFAVGAEAKAKLAEQRFTGSLRPSKTSIRGRLDWSMVAVMLKLRAYAYAFFGYKSYSKTVLSRFYGSVSRNLFNL